jgi:lipopolysaccharide biosynthesis protein
VKRAGQALLSRVAGRLGWAAGQGRSAGRTSNEDLLPPSASDLCAAVPFGYRPEPLPASPKLAVICHLYYDDLAGEFRDHLRNIPIEFDTFISTDTAEKRAAIEQCFSWWSAGKLELRLVPNRGRDIAPKLIAFRDVYASYDLCLHLHSKKTEHSAEAQTWRRFLLDNLLGSAQVVTSVLDAFDRRSDLGMVASSHYPTVRDQIGWGGNFALASPLTQRMGISVTVDRAIDFPSGSMFWARTAALRPLLDLNLAFEDFADERGQKDGTLAHTIERLYFFACERAGLRWMKIHNVSANGPAPGLSSVEGPQALDHVIAADRLSNPGETVAS